MTAELSRTQISLDPVSSASDIVCPGVPTWMVARYDPAVILLIKLSVIVARLPNLRGFRIFPCVTGFLAIFIETTLAASAAAISGSMMVSDFMFVSL